MAFEIGRFFYGIREYENALNFYRDSSDNVGQHHVTFHNMGLCYYSMGEREDIGHNGFLANKEGCVRAQKPKPSPWAAGNTRQPAGALCVSSRAAVVAEKTTLVVRERGGRGGGAGSFRLALLCLEGVLDSAYF